MIKAKNINFYRGKRQILKNCNYSSAQEEITVILGPNGSGKTTLLQCLTGFLKAESGHIQLGDRELSQWTLRELAQSRAVMSQSGELQFPFSVEEVVLFGRHPHNHGHAGEEDREIVRQALSQIDALHLLNRRYTQLSGGERQRVQLARALAQIWSDNSNDYKKRHLFLDEPTASLDLAHQEQVLLEVKKLSELGLGITVILHDLNLAARHADRVVLLHEGHILKAGTRSEVFQAEEIETCFGYPVHIGTQEGWNCPLITPKVLSA